uniref:Uncharacterized protein n=1 Tax=viral metagenome TaxID=1070528 RepID=A0A6C0D6R7_9ZZZZ
MSSKYEPPKVHSLNADEQEFIKTLSLKELALHNLAIQKLGSSYFVWKSHAFQAWKQSKNANSK